MGWTQIFRVRLRRRKDTPGPGVSAPLAPRTALEVELDARDNRARFPHCDSLVLHSPGVCRYCDHYPDRQAGRVRSRIGFSDQATVPEGWRMCPSTVHRPPARRDRWPGNVAVGYGEPTPTIWGDLDDLPGPEEAA